MRRLMLAALVLGVVSVAAAAGEEKKILVEVITNDDVIALHEAGVEGELILLKIKHSSCRFDISTAEMVRLKKADVPIEVRREMWKVTLAETRTVDQEIRLIIQRFLGGPTEYKRGIREARLIGKRAVPELIKFMIADDNHPIRAGCAESLMEIGDKRALEPLLGMLDDREASVRDKVAKAVATLAEKDTADKLMAKMKKKPFGLDAYVLALGHMREKRALKAIVEVLKSTAPGSDRAAAAFALGLLGDKSALKPLRDAVADDALPEVRISAAKALIRFTDKEALRAVLKSVDRYPDTRAALASLLRHWKEESAVEALIELLRDKDKNVQNAAWDSLKQLTGNALGRDYEAWQSWWELAKIQGGVRF